MDVAHLVDAQHLADLAQLLRLCARYDDYPREANFVHALATGLRRAGRTALLEAPYWARRASSPGWPKADLWCSVTQTDAELCAEVKIAQRHAGRPSRLGTESAPKILTRWGEDVWRLLIGPHPEPATEIHCALVVYAWGTAPPLAPRTASPPSLEGTAIDADAVQRALQLASEHADPLASFVEGCAAHFGVTVTAACPVDPAAGTIVQAIVVEWIQLGRATAADVHAWHG